MFPPTHYPRVADIAGGKGYLRLALSERGYDCTTFDHRRTYVRGHGKQVYRWFSPAIKDHFDLLVGLHPDEATDVIILEAARRKMPFMICPCCIKPYAAPFNGSYRSANWIKHLETLAVNNGFVVDYRTLRMNGKSLVLIGRPKRGYRGKD